MPSFVDDGIVVREQFGGGRGGASFDPLRRGVQFEVKRDPGDRQRAQVVDVDVQAWVAHSSNPAPIRARWTAGASATSTSKSA